MVYVGIGSSDEGKHSHVKLFSEQSHEEVSEHWQIVVSVQSQFSPPKSHANSKRFAVSMIDMTDKMIKIFLKHFFI